MIANIKMIWALLWFYLRNRSEAHDLWDDLLALAQRSLALARQFKKDNPDVPLEWLPTPKEAAQAIQDQQAGRTDRFTPKPVDQWSMREWETYWKLGDGAM